MRDILPNLERWQVEKKQVALATVIQTWGSAPRPPGASMAVTFDGEFCGSVSGGCVENAVIEAALDVLRTNRARLLHYGVADETAWQVGLACGGSIDIFVRPLDGTFYEAVRAAWMEQESQFIHVTVIRGPEHILGREVLMHQNGLVAGTIGNQRDQKALEPGREILVSGKARRLMLDAETELFIEPITPPPTLVIVGGVHISMALATLARKLDFRTILVDPRSVWGNEARFPDVDRLIQAWPQQAFQQVQITPATAIVMLTHDPKLDDPALKIGLSSSAFYVGALGSRKTNAKRRERLLEDGLSEEQWARLHAPIGLDIGAETPEEIALAILSEIVAAYRRRNRELVGLEAASRPDPVGAA